jgi:type VII secretion integral membrane protein EccD
MTEGSPDPVLRGQDLALDGDAAALWDGDAVIGNALLDGTSVADEASRPPTPGGDLCRLTFCGPATSVELAVPVHVPLIDLLPALVGHLKDNLPDAGLEHGGWVLQRLGEQPLREELSVAALGLHDGDVVHLRPRSGQLPPVDFDDLIDGIASGIAQRPDRWRPDMSRTLLAWLVGLPLAAGAVLLAGHPGPVAAGIAAVLTLLLFAFTAAASRGLGQLATARMMGAAAIVYAAVAGGQLPLLYAQTARLLAQPGPGPMLLAGGAAAAGAAVVAAMLIGGRDPVFTGVTFATVLVAVGGAVAAFGRVGFVDVAAVMLALVMPLGAAIPVLSFRLARMRLDPTPTTPEELQEDLDPVPGAHVMERTRLTDRYMSAIYWAIAAMAGTCLTVLGFAAGWPAHLVAIDAIVLILLHARSLGAARLRLAAIIPASLGAAVLVTVAGLHGGAHTWLALLGGVIMATVLLWTAERTLPGRRLVPYWGRAGDLLQSLTAVALIPAVLWLLNAYQFVRSLHS